MSTAYPAVFRALAAEFARDEVKTLTKSGRQLRYITARTAMNRLDTVLGPENWEDEYTLLSDNSVMCRLTIQLPDGRLVIKADAGGMAGMADAGDDDKSGFSDAFKRAAAKFGVARYLYNDGVPDFGGPIASPEAPPPPPNNDSGHGRGKYGSPKQVADLDARVKAFVEAQNARWLDEWTRHGEGVADGIRDLLRPEQVIRHLLKWALLTKRLAPVGVTFDAETGEQVEKVSTQQARQYVALVFAREPEALAAEAEVYARQKAAAGRAEWRAARGEPASAGEEPLPEPGWDG